MSNIKLESTHALTPDYEFCCNAYHENGDYREPLFISKETDVKEGDARVIYGVLCYANVVSTQLVDNGFFFKPSRLFEIHWVAYYPLLLGDEFKMKTHKSYYESVKRQVLR